MTIEDIDTQLKDRGQEENMGTLGTHFENHLKEFGFSVEAKQWGQPRPYADHIFSGTLTILAPIEEDERLQVRRR